MDKDRFDGLLQDMLSTMEGKTMTKDERIVYLHKQGLTQKQISVIVGACLHYVSKIINNSLHSKK